MGNIYEIINDIILNININKRYGIIYIVSALRCTVHDTDIRYRWNSRGVPLQCVRTLIYLGNYVWTISSWLNYNLILFLLMKFDFFPQSLFFLIFYFFIPFRYYLVFSKNLKYINLIQIIIIVYVEIRVYFTSKRFDCDWQILKRTTKDFKHDQIDTNNQTTT